MKKFDFIIIGGGAAAFAAAIRANEIGKKVALINTGLPVGGTCVNVGCVPSKALIHAAEVMHHSIHHGIPGIGFKRSSFSFLEVIQDELRLVEQMQEEKYEKVLKHLKNVTFVDGHAVFIDDHTIEVNDEKMQADKFLIATGSTAHGIPVPGLEEAGFLTHIEALKLEKQPKSLIVIGAGPVGLEFSQMYARFGAKVTILQRADRIMPPVEPELTDRLTEIFKSEGIQIFTGTNTVEVKKGKEKKVIFEQKGQRQTISAEEILIAAGKTPNTDGLGLEKAGVQINEKKAIIVNQDYTTNIPHIYAAGDVAVLPLRLETTAGKEGTYVAENALLEEKKSIDYDTVPWTVFSDPELAGVGLTDAQAIERGFTCTCRTVTFDMVPKAHIIKDTRGLIKMVIDSKSRKILGIHILAPRAGDIIAMAMMIVRNKMTIDDVIDTVPIFPTLSEAIKIAAYSFEKDLKTLSCCT